MQIDKFASSKASRALLLTLIDFLDLSVKDPDAWPALETLLWTALRATQRETWLEAEKLGWAQSPHHTECALKWAMECAQRAAQVGGEKKG